MKADTDMDVFADEHMVEMNRRQVRGGGRRHSRLRLSRSPTPLPPTPPLTPTTPSAPPPSSSPSSGQSENTTESKNPSDDRENHTSSSLHAANGSDNSKHNSESGLKDKVVKNSTMKQGVADVGRVQPAPFTSSALPDDKINAVSSTSAPPTNGGGSGMRTPLDKVQQLSRKRERTPSPTLNAGLPNSKRAAILNSSSSVSGAAAPGVSSSTEGLSKGVVSGSGGLGKNNSKTPSPLPNSRIASSASKVLTEEIQKQQGQENARLKLLIFKEIRKPGKSEFCVPHFHSLSP